MKQDKSIKTGTLIDSYKIVKKIGEGGMGAVYEAYEDLLNRRVALKFITQEHNEKKDELLKRFRIEAKALAKIQHQNVVTIYSVGVYEGEPYIAMEYVDGKTLKEILKEQIFPLQKALPLFLQLLEGVRALHDCGIIHRDLKPHNIVIQKNGQAKIVDFGIAKLNNDDSDVTKVGAVLGSVRYMSPEVAMGKIANKQADIRSLGLIFYEMLIGKSPYTAKEFHLLLQEVIKKDVRIPVSAYRKVPMEWRDILTKMCERDKSKRYKSIDDAIADIQPLAMGDASGPININTGPLRRTSSPKSTLKKSYSSQSSYAPLVIAIVLVAGFFFYLMKGSNQSEDLQIPPPPPPVSEYNLSPAEAPNEELDLSSVDEANTTRPDPKPVVERADAPSPEPVSKDPAPSPKVAETIVHKPQPIKRRTSRPLLVKKFEKVILRFENWGQSRGSASLPIVEASLPSLKWKSGLRSEAYEIQISKDINFSKIVLQKKTRDEELTWEDPLPGVYYWRVRGLSDVNLKSPFSEIGKIYVKLPAPQLSFQSPHIIRVSQPEDLKSKIPVKLQLQPVPLSWGTKVLVSKDERFKDILSSIQTQDQSVEVSIEDSNTYFVKAVAINDQGDALGTYSSVSPLVFQKTLKLSSPKIIGPRDDLKYSLKDPKKTYILFKWKKVKYANSYTIQFSKDPKFEKLLLERKLETLKYIHRTELPVGTIYWRIKAYREEHDSKWSKSRTLKVSKN